MTRHAILRLFCFLPLLAQSARAQVTFPAGSIPSALLVNAHSVVRQHETTFLVHSAGEATQRIHSVVTVLDAEGDEQATRVVSYDKLSKITSFEGALYDAAGQLIKKLKKADIDDYSSFTDYNFFDDNRVKVARFPRQPAYPYTVEFTVESQERNLMFYPTWAPQAEEHRAVEQARFQVTLPPGLNLRYKELNLPSGAVPGATPQGGKTYSWQLTNLPAREFEPLSPPAREQLPVVYTAPLSVEVQNYKGKLASWEDVATFYFRLNEGRDQLPEALRQQVMALTADEATKAGKVQKLYQFLQAHTRYVSIQLGIGGWQTMEASKVAATQYGDCKALTNYAQAMLKLAGITAYPALVRAGSNQPDALTDFPSFQFNHVILCVPDGRDTTFLECTSDHGPVGYVGDFTGNRHALLITPTGGKLIRTPAYRSVENRQQRTITVVVTEQGDATAQVRTRYTGLQQDEYTTPIHEMNRDAQRSWLLKRIHLPAFELTDYAFTQTPGRIPAVTETLQLAVRRWATTSGTRLYLPLNLLPSAMPMVSQTQPRQTAIDLGDHFEFEDSDTIRYQLPKGYTPESFFPPIVVDSRFGRYTAQVSVTGEHLTYIRRLTMHRGRYPASDYPDWIAFRKKLAKADRGQLVFVKSN